MRLLGVNTAYVEYTSRSRIFVSTRFSIVILLLTFCDGVFAQDGPTTSFESMIGQWTSIQQGEDVAFRVDDKGRVYSFAGDLSGRIEVKNGVGGSNYAVYTSGGSCFYNVRFYDSGGKAIWNLVDNKGSIKCPFGNFAREDSIAEVFPDTRIKIIKPQHDRVLINKNYGYEVFVYDSPVYGVADTGISRKNVYFSTCSHKDKICDSIRAEDKFCELQDMQSAYPPDTRNVDSREFKNSWYWDIFSGRSIRDNEEGAINYLSTAYCRLR